MHNVHNVVPCELGYITAKPLSEARPWKFKSIVLTSSEHLGAPNNTLPPPVYTPRQMVRSLTSHKTPDSDRLLILGPNVWVSNVIWAGYGEAHARPPLMTDRVTDAESLGNHRSNGVLL